MLYNVGVHVVRDGSFLQAIEGSIQFLQADLVSEQSRQYGLFQIRALPVSSYMYRILCTGTLLGHKSASMYITSVDSPLVIMCSCNVGGAHHQACVSICVLE